MEDIVAIEVRLRGGIRRYFLTWGRVFDAVNPTPLIDCISTHIRKNALGGEPESISICKSLQEARDEPYFFEALFALSQTKIPRGDGYDGWRAHMRDRLESGHELYFLGKGARSEELL